MAPFRPRPHTPVPGSVRPHDVPRLHRLRMRMIRRWERRQKRRLRYLAMAFVAMAGTMSLGVAAFSTHATGRQWAQVEVVAFGTLLAVPFWLAVYALWRSDRIRRRARSARIRLHQTERRLAALRGVRES